MLSSLFRFGDPAAAAPAANVGEPHEPLSSDSRLNLEGVPAVTASATAAGGGGSQDVPLHPDVHKKFEPLAKLGAGGYATVLSVRDRASGCECVIKKITDAYSNAADAQRVVREVAYQRTAAHPNLLPLLDTFCSGLTTDVYLLCPVMEMDLNEAIRANRLTSVLQKQCIAFQLTCALGHMHASGVLHRDLKPPNVLLNSDCVVRLCDFGLALVGSKPDADALVDLRAETPHARALLDALPPVPEPPTRLPKLMPRAPAEGIELCKGLLQMRPSERLDAAAVLRHPFMQGFVRDDPSRLSYAASSLVPPKSGPFAMPVDDDARLSAREYRALLEGSLATALADPILTMAPSGADEEDDMGA